MSDVHKSVQKKVGAIFTKLAGKRARSIESTVYPRAVQELIAQALAGSYSRTVANEMAFHLVDWKSDAGFLVALVLFPKEFTRREIRAGMIQLLVHVPHLVIAAARLGDHSTEDIFARSELSQPPLAASKPTRHATRTRRQTTSASRRLSST